MNNVIQDLAKALDVDRGTDSSRVYLTRLCRAALVFITEHHDTMRHAENNITVWEAGRISRQHEVDELTSENDTLQEHVAELHDKVYALEKSLKRMKGLANRESKRPSKSCG